MQPSEARDVPGVVGVSEFRSEWRSRDYTRVGSDSWLGGLAGGKLAQIKFQLATGNVSTLTFLEALRLHGSGSSGPTSP